MKYLQQLECEKCGIKIEKCYYCSSGISCEYSLCDSCADGVREFEVYVH